MPAQRTRPEDRDNFGEVVLTYNAHQARAEAARCLDCDTYCSLCVGVCPNLALLTYESEPLGRHPRARQPFQVAVLADLCNECGNCTTFCPAAGRPYRDKPRLYLDRAGFEAQQDNAFMVFSAGGRWAIDARWRGSTHRIELDEIPDAAGDDRRNAEPYASMAVLLRGIAGSMPHLPGIYKE